MPTFYDSQGNAHILAAEIGRGGEGTVFYVEGNTELVAKIYHETIDEEKAQKLRLMADNKNERLLRVAAWVVETLHNEPNGKTVGFLMPNIKAKEIHELYSLKSRRIHFPEATWHYLVHTATNLARAFYSLHKYSHVIGDVNHGNCVVLADGTVKLIDCDSYAISNGKKRFRCEVGVATHLAPELQKANLRDVERLPEHDNFALAVVIFQLLFLGRHPFAGNYLGDKDKTLEDCIREFRFAYGKDAKKRDVQQPPGTLHLEEASPRIAALFDRAFDERSDNRPSPREWVEALVDLSNSLAQCGINPGHRFYQNLETCPWCRIESQTGLMLFPFIISEEQNDGERTFNIFTVEKLINNLGVQRNLPAKLSKPTSLVKPEPATEVVEKSKLYRNQQIIIVSGYFLALLFFNFAFGILLGTIFGIFLMMVIFSVLGNDGKKMQNTLMAELVAVEDKWKLLEKEWNLSSSPQMFAGDIKAIKQKVSKYKHFQVSARKELIQAEKTHKHREFTNYLRSHRLANNDIEGISDQDREELIKQNVWTAAEIDEKRFRDHYHLNDKIINNLLNWRKKVEADFSLDTNDEDLKNEKERILGENRQKSAFIEKEIETSLESLQKRSIESVKSQKLLVPQSQEIAKDILQCQSNLDAVGDSSMALISLILITFIVPFFGGMFSEIYSPRETIEVSKDYESDSGSDEILESPTLKLKDADDFVYNDEYMTREEMESLDVPDIEITHNAIELLDNTTREYLSDNLIRQAIWLVKDSKDNYKKADAKVKLAQKVSPENYKAFEQYGKALYDQGAFEKSLTFLKSIEWSNEGDLTRLYIGLNSLELKRYIDAREALLNVVRDNPTNFAYYNLGLAYKHLNEYEKAARSFEYAIQMNFNDVDSHYELGYIFFKLNNKESFNNEYSILLDLDDKKAAELLKNSYKLPPSKNGKAKADIETKTAPVRIEERTKSGRGSGQGSGRGSGVGYGTGRGSSN